MPGTTRPAKSSGTGIQSRSVHNRRLTIYALISLGSFLCAAALLAVMMGKADALTRLGLIGHIYYPVLVIFGLCSAVFLFGVLQSYATYRGRHFGGVLEMGGPAVVFVLVIVGGKVLAPDAQTFSITICVHGPEGPQDVVLRNSGTVALYLDERVPKQIGDAGQVVFPAVPARFRDQAVPVALLSDAYEADAPTAKLRLTPPLVYLPARLKKGHISLHVSDEKGAPVADAEIRVDAVLLGKTSDAGDFQADLTLNSPDQNPKLRVRKAGYQSWSEDIDPHAKSQIEIQLKSER